MAADRPSGEIQTLILEQLKEVRADQKAATATMQQTALDVAAIKGTLLVGETRMDAHESRIAAVEARCSRKHDRNDDDSSDYRPSSTKRRAVSATADTETLTAKRRLAVTIDVATATKWGMLLGAAAAGAWAAFKTAGAG